MKLQSPILQKYEAALRSCPHAGAGVHSWVMTCANLAAFAGVSPADAEREILQAMTRPPSPSAEVGDEFGLFAHRITGDVTDEMARIWDLIKSHILFGPIKAEDSDIPLSVSAGMACYGEDTTDIYDLIEYADFAMYKAKRSGKNRYAVFGLEEYEKTKEEKNQALGRI